MVADPNRLYVAGHSAGAHLTAMTIPLPEVRGGIAISGIYDLEPIRLNYLNEKLALDTAEAERNSPVRHLPVTAGELFVAYCRFQRRRSYARARDDRNLEKPHCPKFISPNAEAQAHASSLARYRQRPPPPQGDKGDDQPRGPRGARLKCRKDKNDKETYDTPYDQTSDGAPDLDGIFAKNAHPLEPAVPASPECGAAPVSAASGGGPR